MIKGILFDKDGTLLDFNRTWLRPYQEATRYLAHSVGRPALASTLMQTGGYIEATGRWMADSLLASGSNQQILEHWGQQIGQPTGQAKTGRDHQDIRRCRKPLYPGTGRHGGFFSAIA